MYRWLRTGDGRYDHREVDDWKSRQQSGTCGTADATVSIVACRHGIQPNQLFAWRELASQGALTARAAEEEVVPASEDRALRAQMIGTQRLLGKKTMESEILKEALENPGSPKKSVRLALSSKMGILE